MDDDDKVEETEDEGQKDLDKDTLRNQWSVNQPNPAATPPATDEEKETWPDDEEKEEDEEDEEDEEEDETDNETNAKDSEDSE